MMPIKVGQAVMLGVLLASLPARAATQPSDGTHTGGIVLLVVVLACYFLPAIVAAGRRHHNAGAIFFLDLLLGWTVVGWIAAFIWALTNPARVVVTGVAPAARAPPGRYPCPHCAEPIVLEARVCRFCDRELPVGWSNSARRPAQIAGR
jgi:uncharacterized membrane protein YhaH (DUF805 family)